MVASEIQPSKNPASASPEDGFLALLPRIQIHARMHFRHLLAVDREEAVAEAVAGGYVAYRRHASR